ncbi:hybrid-cluster NAD(P)-dependent oxidoreductase [Aquabacterium sp.]|uniref:hybrid-cluster NAD(P)-dependent oxidoreductase n=1 Tax=Aquabacterium sp. TaxID=1872578 RepID=UPI0025C27326|nr:hybrid-cluster NAD(P)-dependent oxidoreductase [Aquabacterium sp.]
MNTVPAWSSETDDTLVCVQVRQETHDVKTFVFNTPAPRRFAYLPGQFLTLSLPIGQGGEAVLRCYTLSSSPTRPDRIAITVKRVPGGPVSNWLHDNLKVGDSVSAMGPAGEFTCFQDQDGVAQAVSLSAEAKVPAYLFISGGSGITPLMSMARALVDQAAEADIVFVHAARTPADVVFAEELTLLARNHPRLRLAIVCESAGSTPTYAGYTGRLDAGLLPHIAPDFAQRDVYTCGPAPFMGAVRTMLAQAGHPPARYREESFSFESLAPEAGPAASAPPAGEAAPAAFRISLSVRGDQFDCQPGQSLLAAAGAAGVRLPASCSNGLCGTCKTKKVSGEVEMAHKGGIRQREVDQGWILPCCSKPLSDVVLER